MPLYGGRVAEHARAEDRLPAGAAITRVSFDVPIPGYPDDTEHVDVVARRGGWDRGAVQAWEIVKGGFFWTRARDGFLYQPSDRAWTFEEAMIEAAQHAVPFALAQVAGGR
jgi:hypothetical protein